ncbi:MAG: hypothetical protein ACI9F9_000031 [Candidatus Paceibacteria bacterium]|jgi:hypothetical protein
MRSTLPLLLVLLGAGSATAQGISDLSYTPSMTNAQIGDVVDINIVATSQTSTLADIGALDTIVSYDPAVLTLLSSDQANAGYAWFASGFFPDPDNINVDITDGEAMFTALAQVTVPAVPPQGAGLIITTLHFQVNAASTGSQIVITPLSGAFGKTKVLDFYNANLEITGDISSVATVVVGGGGPNPGSSYCAGDGTGSDCPCSANGAPGAGCLNSGGTGATLVGMGNPSISNDTFELHISGVAGSKPGLVLRGANMVNGGNGLPVGDGLFCVTSNTARSHVQITTGAGTTVYTNFSGQPFGASSYGAGIVTNYQFWYRDPQGTCSSGGFNFTNAWSTTWQM